MYVLRLKYSSNYAITTDNQSVTPSVLVSNYLIINELN